MNPWKIPEHFTPGPWALKYGRPCVVLPANESQPRRAAIAQCALSHGIGWARVEDEANARLIAAAPDLLAALCSLVWRCDGDEGVRADGSNIDTLAAHVAIDKALGVAE